MKKNLDASLVNDNNGYEHLPKKGAAPSFQNFVFPSIHQSVLFFLARVEKLGAKSFFRNFVWGFRHDGLGRNDFLRGGEFFFCFPL